MEDMNVITLSGSIQIANNIILNGNIIVGGSNEYEVYTGDYEVWPKVTSQQLETENKLMIRNVTVYEIKYDETSNLYGTTVSIAS